MSSESDLYFRQLPVGEMANLAYLIGSRSTREALVVDPAWNVAGLCDQALQDGMKVVGALVTHFHQDHIGGRLFGHEIEGLRAFLEHNPAPVYANKLEAMGVAKIADIEASEVVGKEPGDTIELGGITIRMLHTPGHTPGSQCFLVEEAGQVARLVAGDTLFLNGCGRVDLPGSNAEDMYYSLNHTLKALPDETVLYPGHLYSPEGSGSLGEQKRTNPYLRVTSLEMFLDFMGLPH